MCILINQNAQRGLTFDSTKGIVKALPAGQSPGLPDTHLQGTVALSSERRIVHKAKRHH